MTDDNRTSVPERSYARVVGEEDVLGRLAVILRTVPAARIQRHVMQLRGEPADGSPYVTERREFGDSAEALDHAPNLAYLLLMDAPAEHMDAIDSIISAASARRHPPRPLLRSIVEHSARASWLMQAGIGARNRAARAWLAEAVSADSMLGAARATQNADAISDAERRSNRVRCRIAHWFGVSALTTRGGWSVWSLAGERYGSLTATVEAFASRHSDHGSGRSFYMLQSTLMHPSAASATAFSTRQPDGRLVFEDFNLTYMVRTVLNAVWSWRIGVGEYLAYHGWESPELDAWWSHTKQVFSPSSP